MTNITIMQIILLLIQIESNGQNDAIGDNGRAVGCLQIHEIMVDEVNRIMQLKGITKLYTYDDRYSMRESIQMAYIYMTYHVTKEKLGRRPVASDYALSWNQGSSWHKKKPNQRYLNKFNRELEKNGFIVN